MSKAPKKLNPYSKRNVVQFRVDTEEMRSIITKAIMYTDGNVSEFARQAALNYKPIKKG